MGGILILLCLFCLNKDLIKFIRARIMVLKENLKDKVTRQRKPIFCYSNHPKPRNIFMNPQKSYQFFDDYPNPPNIFRKTTRRIINFIRRKFKGVNTTVFLENTITVFGEVVFNFKDILSLKSVNTFFINPSKIVFFI